MANYYLKADDYISMLEEKEREIKESARPKKYKASFNLFRSACSLCLYSFDGVTTTGELDLFSTPSPFAPLTNNTTEKKLKLIDAMKSKAGNLKADYVELDEEESFKISRMIESEPDGYYELDEWELQWINYSARQTYMEYIKRDAERNFRLYSFEPQQSKKVTTLNDEPSDLLIKASAVVLVPILILLCLAAFFG